MRRPPGRVQRSAPGSGKRPHDDAILHDARLLVSELVTNGIRHARISADQPLHLTASLSLARLRLDLHDHGTRGTVAPRRHEPREAAAGGFGLNLVAQLSSAWGVQRDAHGTTVWLELPMAATG